MKALGGVALAVVVAIGTAACSSGGGLGGGLSGTCKFGYGAPNENTAFATKAEFSAWEQQQDIGGPSYPVGMVNLSAGQTVQVASIVVAYYTKSGTEITSNTVNVNQAITSGQTMSAIDWNPPSNASSCQAVSWTSGS